jgi:hypothetical protein
VETKSVSVMNEIDDRFSENFDKIRNLRKLTMEIIDILESKESIVSVRLINMVKEQQNEIERLAHSLNMLYVIEKSNE